MKEKILIFGPCAVESEQQLAEIVAEKCHFPDFFGQIIFRGGVWKPRTSPQTFQGIGDKALPWLKNAGQKMGYPVATEVANNQHIQACVEAGIDYCWIGARTSVNPILVQELADYWQLIPRNQLPKGILVKNPMAQDVALWMGAVERLQTLGVPIWAIHRGINHKACWGMAFEFRQKKHDIPMLLDPSHISGDATMVAKLAQQAMDLDYDGLMIEVHPHPTEALSDAKQQITMNQLQTLLNTLIVRTTNTPNKSMLELREQIDEIDDELWNLLVKRLELSRQIGKIKKENNEPILQVNRLDNIIQQRIEWGKKHQLPSGFVEQMMHLIHEQSVEEQM